MKMLSNARGTTSSWRDNPTFRSSRGLGGPLRSQRRASLLSLVRERFEPRNRTLQVVALALYFPELY
jgi:hypothetical protein